MFYKTMIFTRVTFTCKKCTYHFVRKKKILPDFSACISQTTTIFIWTCQSQNVKVRTNHDLDDVVLDNKKTLKQNKRAF